MSVADAPDFEGNLNEVKETSGRSKMFLISQKSDEYKYEALKKLTYNDASSQFQFQFNRISKNFYLFTKKE